MGEEKLSREEFIEKYKPLLMLTLDRDELVKLVETDERVKEYLRRLDELHKDEYFVQLCELEEKYRDIINYMGTVIDKKDIVIQEIALTLKKSGLDNYEVKKLSL